MSQTSYRAAAATELLLPEGIKTYAYRKLNTFDEPASIAPSKWFQINLATPQIFTMPSLTIPDEGLTVRQILTQFTTGVLNQQREPVYQGDEFIPDFANMDLADREEYLKQVKQSVSDKTEELKQLKLAQSVANQKKKELAEELAAAAMAERLKKRNTDPEP